MQVWLFASVDEAQQVHGYVYAASPSDAMEYFEGEGLPARVQQHRTTTNKFDPYATVYHTGMGR